MELVFDKTELMNSLQKISGVASGKSVVPILSNLLLRASDGQITITGTDLEVGIRVNVPGAIREEGSITVNARKIIELVNEFPNEEIELKTTENHKVELKCGVGNYYLFGLPDDEFPQLPTAENEGTTINSEHLCQTLKNVYFAAHPDNVNYILNAVFFSRLEGKTDIVATDRNTMAVIEFPPIQTDDDRSQFIIPLKGVIEIVKIFSESDEITIQFTSGAVIISNSEITLTTRLLEGEYPEYQLIFSDKHTPDKTLVVNRENLLRAVRRVALLSDPKNFGICLEITPVNIKVTARSIELGEAYENVSLVKGEGETVIGLDSRNIAECLSHIETETIDLKYSEPTHAVFIRPTGVEGCHYMLAPMRVEAIR